MRQAVIATLSYADVFDYPLTRDEIALWIIGRPIPEKILSVLLPEKDIQSGRRALYHLSGRQRIVITQRGRAAAVLIGYDEYRELTATAAEKADPEALEMLGKAKGQSARGEHRELEEGLAKLTTRRTA